MNVGQKLLHKENFLFLKKSQALLISVVDIIFISALHFTKLVFATSRFHLLVIFMIMFLLIPLQMTGSMKTNIIRLTVKNAVISPNFLVWKFCGKAQFSHSFGRIARNYPETVAFCKISTPGNQVKLRHFSQWEILTLTRSELFERSNKKSSVFPR